MKEVKKCPLSLVDWVNYLMQEQNIERFIFYNEELMAFTLFIVLLTGMNILILITTFPIDVNIKNFIQVVTWIGLFTYIGMIIFVFFRLHKYKTRMKNIVQSEVIIISDILRGEETDTQKFLERYDSIWKNKKNIL